MKRLLFLPVLVAMFLLLPTRPASATPHYSVQSAHACNTCHVEPTGWYNPDRYADRRCTLDCQGCHVSPTGGGMRTPLGEYYAQEELAMFGRRPSAAANPGRFLEEGYPEEGRFRLFEGFEGWWPGDVQHRTIDDRYGSINPAPQWQIGGDYRAMMVLPADNTGRDIVAFPMEAQTYVAVHPYSNLTAYLDLGIQGAQDRSFDNVGGTQPADNWVRDRLWLREIFVMLHDLPYSSYVRAGRFNLPYGWRINDHTAYIRQGMFDQYRQAYGVEFGMAPNEYWSNLALYYQGVDNWPGEGVERFDEGFGATAQGGMRWLGLSVGASLHAFAAKNGTDELMAGPMWGLNLYPVTYLGEVDYRRTTVDGEPGDRNAMFAFHEVRWDAIRGLAPRLRYEWGDSNMDVRDDHLHRLMVGVDWNIFRGIQLDLAFRQKLAILTPDTRELLVQFHGYF
jgi:hypothetical protein